MDPMRLILLAVGGYLVYKATIGKAAAVPPAAGGTTPGGTTTTGGTTTPGTSTGSGTTTSGGTTQQFVFDYAALWNEDLSQVSRLQMPFQNGKDYVLARGAVGDAAAIAVLNAHNVLLGPDQWNVYHVLGGAPVIDPTTMDTFIAGDRSPITVTEYRTRLLNAGLSGVGLGNWGGIWA